MINTNKANKIKRFMQDVEMSEAVYEVLLNKYVGVAQYNDVETLAASRIAINLLQDAWRELERMKLIEAEEATPVGQVGL